MIPAESAADQIDRISRRLLQNLEYCDRSLVARFRLTRSQAYTLQALEDTGETTMNGLADEMRLHGTTMTRMVDSLVDKGLLERATDPGDRRVVRVRLSPTGREMVVDLRKRKRDFLAIALRGIPETELRGVLNGLHRMAALAEQWGAASSQLRTQ